MQPSEVPDDLVRAALDAATPDAQRQNWPNPTYKMRLALAAVLDRHEQMVLQRASEKLMARAAAFTERTGPRATWRRATESAARHILPPVTPEQLAEAIADGSAIVMGCPSLDEEQPTEDLHAGVVDLTEDETESFMSALTEGRADPRAELVAAIRAPFELTNAEMAALGDGRHEECGEVWRGYFLRIIGGES